MWFEDAISGYVCGDRASIFEAIRAIQESPRQFVVVVNNRGTLVGTVTDGDIRRALIKGISFDECVTEAMNTAPVYFSASTGRLSRPDSSVAVVPVVDDKLRPIGIRSRVKSLLERGNTVLLMAGGKGTRLLPYTLNTPKPLVEIHGRALIEMLIERFVSCGFSRFLVSVNHLAEQIKDRLGDGTNLGVEIEYLHEPAPLGTAGAIGLIKAPLESDLIVANADLVTGCDFGALLDYHQAAEADITVATRRYVHAVPFGVIEVDGEKVRGISEKPSWQAPVSAGIYCISPEALGWVEHGVRTEMPELIEAAIASSQGGVRVFPIHEEWHDVGNPGELERLRTNPGIREMS